MRTLTTAMIASAMLAGTARAQLDWLLFEDSMSTSTCDVVNAANAELIVLNSTFEMMIVTGQDTILSDTFVDEQNFVFVADQAGELQPAGSIQFAEDGDGFRTLWWLTFDNRAVEIDPLTSEPLAGDALPTEFVDVPCDACLLIDNPPAEVCDPPDGDDTPIIDPDVLIEICGSSLTTGLALCLFGAAGLRFVGPRRSRRPLF